MKNTHYFLIQCHNEHDGQSWISSSIVFRKLRNPQKHFEKLYGLDFVSFREVDRETFKKQNENGGLIL
jgi:c-di-GMP-binding flagellar brake protein YcgR